MRRELVLPALISLLFLVLIAARALAPPARIAPVAERPPPAIVSSSLALQPERVAADVSAILARPLFSQSRRPPDQKQMRASSLTDPRLSAIFVTPSSRQAVFDDGGSRPLVAIVGGHAGPFRVLAIDRDQITVLDGSGRHRILRPTLKDAGSSTAGRELAEKAPESSLSLLQQLQRNGAPHYAVPPPPTIQSLMERLQHPGRE